VLRLAPRALPRALVWRVIFGNPFVMFGWAFAALGMVFVLFFLPEAELPFAGYDRQAGATTTSIEATSSSENDRAIYRVRYTFLDEAGVERRGESFTTDPPAELGAWQVDYRSGEPSESRLHGMRRGRFSPFVLFVLVFPIAGLAIALRLLPRELRDLRLLRHGVETRGKLVGKRETGSSVNEVPVMALTFEYEVDGKTHAATVETLRPGLLEDDEREAMLYDLRSPSRATTLDHLPGSPKVTADGELEVRLGTAIHLLIAPVVFAGLVAATVIRMI
jgi:hypothetical protein